MHEPVAAESFFINRAGGMAGENVGRFGRTITYPHWSKISPTGYCSTRLADGGGVGTGDNLVAAAGIVGATEAVLRANYDLRTPYNQYFRHGALPNQVTLDMVWKYLEAVGYDRGPLAEQMQAHTRRMKEQIAAVAQRKIQESIVEGVSQKWTLKRSMDQMRRAFDGLKKQDVTAVMPNVETVVRTESMTILHASSWNSSQCTPTLQAMLWGFQYFAVGDARTRPTHDAQDGVTAEKHSHFWDEWYPPNGYNCRCAAHPLYDEPTQKKEPRWDLHPDKGFAFNPGRSKPFHMGMPKVAETPKTVEKQSPQAVSQPVVPITIPTQPIMPAPIAPLIPTPAANHRPPQPVNIPKFTTDNKKVGSRATVVVPPAKTPEKKAIVPPSVKEVKRKVETTQNTVPSRPVTMQDMARYDEKTKGKENVPEPQPSIRLDETYPRRWMPKPQEEIAKLNKKEEVQFRRQAVKQVKALFLENGGRVKVDFGEVESREKLDSQLVNCYVAGMEDVLHRFPFLAKKVKEIYPATQGDAKGRYIPGVDIIEFASDKDYFDVATGISFEKTNGLKSSNHINHTVYHEMGHAFESLISESTCRNKAFLVCKKFIAKQFNVLFSMSEQGQAETLSIYGATEEKEMFAECFAEYCASSQPRIFAKLVIEQAIKAQKILEQES